MTTSIPKILPAIDDTVIEDGGYVWTPSSDSSVLSELAGFADREREQGRVILFRGQSQFDWVLDSKFVRDVKMKLFGFKAGEFPTRRAASDRFFAATLHSAFHFKFGCLGQPSQEVLAEEARDGRLDSWFEWMRVVQQFPDHDHRVLTGTFLLDWSLSPYVALWFSCEDPTRDGAVYVWEATKSGAVHTTRKVREHLDEMERHDWRDGPPNGRPIIFCPTLQSRQERANRQKARYVAQMDFRWPLESAWKEASKTSGVRLYTKIKIRKGMKESLLVSLEQHGITRKQLFPEFNAHLSRD